MMLAFDTSGRVGSAAVDGAGSSVVHGVITKRAEHASGLVPLIEEVLSRAGAERADIRTVVVGEGPGSFTGVRVAAATAKGLSRALGIPLVAVSSLAAAAMVADTDPIRYALFDARAERVYGACYGVGSAMVETLVQPHAGELRDVLAGDVPPGAVFVGEGAELHRALIESAGFDVAPTDPDSPLALGLIEYVRRQPGLAEVADVSSWEPEYVRAAGAERLWSR